MESSFSWWRTIGHVGGVNDYVGVGRLFIGIVVPGSPEPLPHNTGKLALLPLAMRMAGPARSRLPCRHP